MGLRRPLKLAPIVAIGALALFPTIAGADTPSAFPFEETFVDVNPCTGLDHTITVTGTLYVYDRGLHGLHDRLDRTVSTSSGFSGHGTEISVDHERIFVVHDLLTNESGEHELASLVIVRGPDGTVRVDRFELSCVG